MASLRENDEQQTSPTGEPADAASSVVEQDPSPPPAAPAVEQEPPPAPTSPRVLPVDALAEDAPPSIAPRRVAETTLRDRARFRGHVDDDGLPNGHGVLYAALGTHMYAGTFAQETHEEDAAASRLRGVQLRPNGTLFAGDFQGDDPHGAGVKRDPFGSQFVGQWREGELDGVGLSVDVDGHARFGQFALNEPVETGEGQAVPWNDAVQRCVLEALLAERHALQDQEEARALELRVLLQGLATIGDAPFDSPEQVEQFTRAEQQALDAFLDETSRQLREVERDADRWKFQEAQLKERQKNLRREITETRAAISYAAKYVALAETRRAHVDDAERTLQSLQLQIQSLDQQLEAPREEPGEKADRMEHSSTLNV